MSEFGWLNPNVDGGNRVLLPIAWPFRGGYVTDQQVSRESLCIWVSVPQVSSAAAMQIHGAAFLRIGRLIGRTRRVTGVQVRTLSDSFFQENDVGASD